MPFATVHIAHEFLVSLAIYAPLYNFQTINLKNSQCRLQISVVTKAINIA